MNIFRLTMNQVDSQVEIFLTILHLKCFLVIFFF